MIRLSLQTEPYWLDLVGGARVRVKPLTMTIYQAALMSARKAANPVPLPGQEPPSIDAVLRDAVFKAEFALALGRYGIDGWEGIVSPDGTAADVTPENIEALLCIPAIGSQFLDQYSASVAQVVAEGNA